MNIGKNTIHSFGEKEGTSHVGTYYLGSHKDARKVLKKMFEESKNVGRIVKSETTSDGFLVQLYSDVVLDFFISSYINKSGEEKSQIAAISQNSMYIPGQNVAEIAKIMHAPIMEDKQATAKDAVSTHMTVANHEELETDLDNFSLRVINKGKGTGKVLTFYDSHSNESQLQPDKIIKKIQDLNLYCSPSIVFKRSVQQLHSQEFER